MEYIVDWLRNDYNAKDIKSVSGSDVAPDSEYSLDFLDNLKSPGVGVFSDHSTKTSTSSDYPHPHPGRNRVNGQLEMFQDFGFSTGEQSVERFWQHNNNITDYFFKSKNDVIFNSSENYGSSSR